MSVHDNLTASSEMKDKDNQSPDLIHQAYDQMWENVSSHDTVQKNLVCFV